MSRIGIMGGTFNPIHNGHIKLAKTAYKQLNLDKVWFMPSKNPPHKKNNNIASENHRVNMIKLAIDLYKEFELSEVELQRDGTTYTVDTLAYLKEMYPDDEFFFILGADSLINIEQWYKPEVLFSLTHFVVASRDDVNKSELYTHCEYLKNKYTNVNISILNMDKIKVSSTELRKIYRDYNHKHHNIDSKVYKYIMDNKVYN
ncbi:MAG: nicotinate-nucleotide adenylyltransferase [Lachnospiraceae bacterium]|nr:nicotinate-nucleotide adenylyltransferase [Lachnospiraceae bacterium]